MSNFDECVHFIPCLRFLSEVVSGVMILTHASGLDSSYLWSQLYSSDQRHYAQRFVDIN